MMLVAGALLGSVAALLVIGSVLVLAELPAVVQEAVLLSSILFLALGQPVFVTELARRLRTTEVSSRVVALGSALSSLTLLALGVATSRML